MSSTQVTSHDINIAGVPLRLKTSHGDEALSLILEMVEKRIDQDIERVSVQKALALACLRLAEDLYVFKNSTSEELDHIEDLANRILSDLQVSQA